MTFVFLIIRKYLLSSVVHRVLRMIINILTFKLQTPYWSSKYREAQGEEIGLKRTSAPKSDKRVIT